MRSQATRCAWRVCDCLKLIQSSRVLSSNFGNAGLKVVVPPCLCHSSPLQVHNSSCFFGRLPLLGFPCSKFKALMLFISESCGIRECAVIM